MTNRLRTAVAGGILTLSLLSAPIAAMAAEEAAPLAAIRFDDVTPDHWAYGHVAGLREANVLAASADGLFRPDDPITRAELVSMVLKARRIDVGTGCAGTFTDAACDAWYTPAAETAFRMAIVEGKGQGIFAPDAAVTRAELFTIVVRAVGERWEAKTQGWQTVGERLSHFSDGSEVPSWARNPVAHALGEEMAKGYPDGSFRPAAAATRAEAAALVSRIMLGADGLQTTEIDGRTIVYRQAYEMTASMYTTGEPGVNDLTYTEVKVRYGTVAVDPNVIPLGSLVYVEDYGYAIAADIGGAIKGMRVDLFTHDYRQAAIEFGMQPRRVWLLP